MTDEERFTIIGRVVSEHEEAKRHLGALHARAENWSRLFYAIATAMSPSAAPGGSWTATDTHFSGSQGSAPVSGAVPSWADVRQLLDEIEATKTRIEQLAQRRKDLGV